MRVEGSVEKEDGLRTGVVGRTSQYGGPIGDLARSTLRECAETVGA